MITGCRISWASTVTTGLALQGGEMYGFNQSREQQAEATAKIPSPGAKSSPDCVNRWAPDSTSYLQTPLVAHEYYGAVRSWSKAAFMDLLCLGSAHGILVTWLWNTPLGSTSLSTFTSEYEEIHHPTVTCVTSVSTWIYFIYLEVPGLSCGIWDLVPWPGIEPGFPALVVWRLSHWTTREIPG